MRRLLTLGYEGLQLQRFFKLLLMNGVRSIVDLRQSPISRKPGFSKSALASAAAAHGLGYTHMPALGCPKDIRNRYHVDGNWSRYTLRFKAYLAAQDSAVAELAGLARRERCCLLCFEADPNSCHRSLVAERLAGGEHSIQVVHLTARDAEEAAQAFRTRILARTSGRRSATG